MTGVQTCALPISFVEANRSGKSGAVIREIAQNILGISDAGDAVVGGPAKKSLLGKLDFKSMLAKKNNARVAEKAPA